MLMKARFDCFYVDPKHDEVDRRLCNWADWVAVRHPSWVSPMFRMARSNARQWHTPELKRACNTLEAAQTEKAVYALPKAHRDVLRWCYVYRYGEYKFRKEAGLTSEGLLRLLHDARTMLANRIQSDRVPSTTRIA